MVKKSTSRTPRALDIVYPDVAITEQSNSAAAEGDVGGEPAKRVVVKCRSMRLVKLISSLNQAQREAVTDIGFGGLLDLKFSHFPIQSTTVFLQAFDDGTHMFKASETKEFLVTKHDVHDCFMLPYGPNDLELVPTGRSKLSNNEVYKSIKHSWRSRYGVTNVRDPIPLGKVLEDLEADVEGGDDFKRLFVMFSMSSFLCPTSNNGADIKLLQAVQDVGAIKHLDWCSYVLDGIVNAGLESRNTPSPRFTLGCIPFIMITYFHRFNFRGEVLPHELPLVKHWNENKLNERVSAEFLSGSLGRAPWSTVNFPRCLQHISEISGNSSEEPRVIHDPPLIVAGWGITEELPLYIGNSEEQGDPPMENKFIQIQLPEGVEDDDEIRQKAVDMAPPAKASTISKGTPTKSPFSTKKVIVKKSHQQIVVKKVQKKNGKKGVSKTEKGSDDESGGSAADEDAYPAKIYCRPLNLSKLIKGFSDEEKEAIREIGFGGLLDLNLTKFPREIIPLLIQSFCPDSLLFKVNEQVSFVLSKYDVYDCFQLPMGDNPLELVPTGRNRLSQAEDCLALKQQWSQRYGICDAKKGIPLGSVARTLTNHHSMNEFKQAFVLYAMGVFLAPTYTTCIDLHLLKAVDNVDNIANIDWCLYVFKKNVEALERTVDKTTCSVCIPFILIAYLHRFAFRGEEMPSSLPLIKHWTYESMYQRVRLELKTGGLGNAPMSAVKYPISILGIEHKVVKNDWRKISSEILKSQNDSKNDSKRNSDEDKGLDSDTRVEKDVEMQSDLEDSNSKDENDGEMKSNSDSQDDEDVEMLCNLNSPENEDEEVTKSPFSKNGATVQGTPMKNITQSVPSACTSSTTKSHKSGFATAKFEGFDTREPEGDEDLDSNSRDENDGEMQSDLFGQDKEREGMECYSDSQDENGKMQCNLNIQENEDEEVTRTLLSMKGGNDGNGATEQGTSIKNINITPSMPRACTLKRPRSDPLTTKFEGYDVRSVFVPTLEKIWRNHGNITKNSIMRSRDMIARALELLATMVRILEDTSVLSLSGSQADHLSSTMSDLRCMGFSVDWLNPFVEKAIKLHKSKPSLDSWNNLCQSSSQVEKHRAVLLDELAKLDEKKNKLKEEIVMVSKRIPFFGQVKFDNPLGSGLT